MSARSSGPRTRGKPVPASRARSNKRKPPRPGAARPKRDRKAKLARAQAALEPSPLVEHAPDAIDEARARISSNPELRRKYVYCIISAKEPLDFDVLGIGELPGQVHTVNHRSIAAVASDTLLEVHEPTRENVLAHERVNEAVMATHTVIPMSFGTVFKTREDIVELLRSAYDAFQDVLVKMDDKLEFGLKVLWDREVIIREIESQDDDVRRLKNEIMSQKGSTYFGRMQYGRLVDAALQARSERYVADIFEQLQRVSVAARANKPIGDKMIMNAAFLVLRSAERAFETAIKAIGAKYDQLTFKFTGPWPPYNFVNIRLKLERVVDPG
jgi:hypothetical protein